MINIITFLSKTNLKIFLSQTYSIELLYMLRDNNFKKKGIEDIYISLLSPKPKQASFNNFIQRLNSKGFLTQLKDNDNRKKVYILSYNTNSLIIDSGLF